MLPICARCGAEDRIWSVEGSRWVLETDLVCGLCLEAPEGAQREELLARFGGCAHSFEYHAEFGSLPVDECTQCGLGVIDPRDEFADAPPGEPGQPGPPAT